jgi:hypothetical protein
MKILDQTGQKFRIGWRGLFSLPISLLESGSDDPGCFLILAFMLVIPEILLSYLKISPRGLEVKYWPFYHINAPWEDIDKLDSHKVLGLIPSQAIFLKQDAPFGSVNILGREVQIGKKKRLIVLNDFQGWSNGKITAMLEEYAPGLISDRDSG